MLAHPDRAAQHPDVLAELSVAANELDTDRVLVDGLAVVVIEAARLLARLLNACEVELPPKPKRVLDRCTRGTPQVDDMRRLQHLIRWHVESPDRAGNGYMTRARERATRH